MTVDWGGLFALGSFLCIVWFFAAAFGRWTGRRATAVNVAVCLYQLIGRSFLADRPSAFSVASWAVLLAVFSHRLGMFTAIVKVQAVLSTTLFRWRKP